MPEFLDHHPGLLFVAATLLPLASFVLILLSFAIKTYFRKSAEGSTGEAIFALLGGPKPGRLAAYVATGAIGLSCVLSVTGFVIYASHHSAHEVEERQVEKKIEKLRDDRYHDKLLPKAKRIAGQIADLELQMASPGNSAEKMKELKAELQTKREELESLETKIKNADKSIKASESRLAELKGEWADRLNWLRIFPATKEITALQQEINNLQAKLPPPSGKGAKATPSEETIAKEIAKKEDQLHELRNHQPGTMLDLGYRIDMLSALMFVMVTFIGTLIHVFSIGYMSDELGEQVADHHVHTADGHLHRRGRFGRFFLYLSLFCFSMLNLVLADNLFQVFISWELVGVCSFLLIGFYFERTSASNAANKAFITNRVGDAGFVIGLLILWTHVGTFNFEEIFQRVRAPLEHSHGQVQMGGQIVRVNAVPAEAGKDDNKYKYAILAEKDQPSSETRALLFPLEASDHGNDLKALDKVSIGDPQPRAGHPVYGSMPYWMLVAAGLGIFLGCVGKSAQFPLQVWLPDAMEGPTPVSALIHAATMVAAGVYLVGRCFPLFTYEALLVIAYTGAITLFVAASIALVMTDIKKVLAYSTVSQLGFMMLALGIGGWVAGLFHLITHAFFKALLFLGSGSVIYGCHHEQEMTKMGGLYPKMKITALTMLVGCLAITGVPLFSGWYSKDAILAQAMGFVMVNKHHVLLFLLPFLTAGLTAFYMFRMWFMTFTGKPRDHHVHEHAHESPWLMTVPLMILAFFSVTVAWGWPIWNPEASWLEAQIHHAQPDSVIADFGTGPGIDEHWDPNVINEKTLEMGDYVPVWRGAQSSRPKTENVRYQAHDYHFLVGNMVLGLAVLAFCLAAAVYYLNLLDPADAKEQFPGVYAFLVNKWYFDAIYSALLVRPALAVAGWCKFFDTKVIDGAVDNTAKAAIQVSRVSGRFDNRIVDGLVNVVARACYGVGNWLRNVQTGYLRSYVVFLVVAAIGIWVILTSLLGASPAGK